MLTDPQKRKRSWLGSVMASFFHHLYHSFAGSYDLVADIVSLGQWKNWVAGVIPFINGPVILEIGFGPGHLQERLNRITGFTVFGLDESEQMANLTKARLKRSSDPHFDQLVRSKTEEMPFNASVFDSVVATFPTPYIVDPATIAQVTRVLKPGGQLVVLLAARHRKNSLLVKLADWLFSVTGQAPPLPEQSALILRRYEEFDMVPTLTWETSDSGLLLLLIARKPKSS